MGVNRYIRWAMLLVLGTAISSCVELNGSGYDSLTEQEKQHVKPCVTVIEKVKNDGNLYEVKVEQVSEFINKKRNVLVYEYLPFCSGESGRSPEEVRTKCVELHLECVVISSVYDGVLPMDKYKFPVFVIDKAPYNTDNYQDYSNEFYKALTHGDDEDLATGSFHYFSKGKYVRSYASVSDITL